MPTTKFQMPTTYGSGHLNQQTEFISTSVVGIAPDGSGQTPPKPSRVVGNPKIRQLAKGWIEYRNPHPESGKTRWRLDRKWHFACGQPDCPHNGIANHKHGTHRKEFNMSEENYVNWKQARMVARRKRRERTAARISEFRTIPDVPPPNA